MEQQYDQEEYMDQDQDVQNISSDEEDDAQEQQDQKQYGDRILDSQEQQPEQQQQQEQQIPKDKKKKKKDEHQRNYYQEYLPPDEDIETKPPIVVVVQGSNKSGKSTLIRSLVKHYTGHKIAEIKGPITIRTGKNQRVTFIECPNDMTALVDLSKIADFALLIIDASIGLQMQTFQFLSLLKCHGFPHVMGILTHLDYFKDSKQLRKTRKKYKKRFEYEVGGNNKLFYLLGCVNQLYPRRDIINLARYISVIKNNVIPWRTHHPYMLIDRWQLTEDGQYNNDSEVYVSFYGYIRGASYRMNNKLHIVGLGDYQIEKYDVIDDPCPEYNKDQIEQDKDKQIKNQFEDDQEQEDNNKVGLKKKKRRTRTLNRNEKLIYAPSCNLGYLNFDKTGGFVTIPQDYVKFTRGLNDQEGEEPEEGIKFVRDLQDIKQTINQKLKKRQHEFELFEGVRLEQQDEENSKLQSDQKMFKSKRKELNKIKQQAKQYDLVKNINQPMKKLDLFSLIYQNKEKVGSIDCSRYHPVLQKQYDIKQLFVTGMDTDILQEQNQKENQQQGNNKKLEIKTQSKANLNIKTNFLQKGQYIKIIVKKILYKHYKSLIPEKPILLCKINAGQDNFGFLKIRFKRHRWYANILKSNDPIIVSNGWRRYQTLIIFATEDPNERLRFLKYSPQHDFCYAIVYGNFSQQNSGCVFMQSLNNQLRKFRIAATGIILEVNKSFQVMKKLKLVGQPFKIFKNTAFVKGMFNSSLEVANYEGAQIKTVSGIRGQIKKPIRQGGQGSFRATFEDKIVMSDLISCRTWYKIPLEKFYNPIVSYENQRLMKTNYQLRVEKQVQAKVNPDSEYKKIQRVPKTFAPLIVPKKLQEILPFKSREKVKINKKQQLKRSQSQGIPKIFTSDKEKEVAAMIQRLNSIRNQKAEQKKQKFLEKIRIRSARQRPKEEKFQMQKKEHKKEKFSSAKNKKRN